MAFRRRSQSGSRARPDRRLPRGPSSYLFVHVVDAADGRRLAWHAARLADRPGVLHRGHGNPSTYRGRAAARSFRRALHGLAATRVRVHPLGEVRVAQSASPVAAAPRDRVFILTCLAVIIAVAWVYLVHLDRQMSSAMEQDAMMAKMGMPMAMPWSATDM